MISISNEQSAIAINIVELEANTHKLISFLGYPDFDVGILLTDSETMQEYNRTYRHKDKPTDVLAFPYHKNLNPGHIITPNTQDDKNLGDIVLCPEYIKQDLEQWDQTFEIRINVLLVHALLHLLGYDHINDEDYEIMKLKEERLLKHLLS